MSLLLLASVSALAPTALSSVRSSSIVATATRRTFLATVLSAPLMKSRLPASADESTCLDNAEVRLSAAQCQPSGLGIIEVKEGTGLQPQAGQTVRPPTPGRGSTFC
jgi:FKBP-type peptidyl-prolyl cis-trans isomerase